MREFFIQDNRLYVRYQDGKSIITRQADEFLRRCEGEIPEDQLLTIATEEYDKITGNVVDRIKTEA